MVTKDIKMGRQRHGILFKMHNDHNLFETQSRDICTPLPLEDLNILDVQLLGHAVRQFDCITLCVSEKDSQIA